VRFRQETARSFRNRFGPFGGGEWRAMGETVLRA